MSEHEVELTDEERAQLDASLKASRNNAFGRLQRLSSTVESIVAARLADAEARAEAAEAAIDRVRKRHPRGDEEPGPLAPGLWCPTCGQERKDNGYGDCPDREALRGDQ